MRELETARLNFRRWRSTDFTAFHKFFSDSTAAEFVGGKKSAEEAWRLMAAYSGHYVLKGYSYLAVEVKESQKLVGSVGLWKSDPWPETELGYWLLPGMQRKGYALEAGAAVLDYAFNVLEIETLVSYIDEKNNASIKLAERLGAFYDGETELLDFGRHLVYRYANCDRVR